jgi:hypothetical protein
MALGGDECKSKQKGGVEEDVLGPFSIYSHTIHPFILNSISTLAPHSFIHSAPSSAVFLLSMKQFLNTLL